MKGWNKLWLFTSAFIATVYLAHNVHIDAPLQSLAEVVHMVCL